MSNSAIILENLSWVEACAISGKHIEIKGRVFVYSGTTYLCEAKFSPAIAIVVEYLRRRFDVDHVIRIATCGSLVPRDIGSVLLFDAAIRDEGTSAGYVPSGYPACASQELMQALRQRLRATEQRFESTYTWTTDCRFQEMEERRRYFVARGITAVDMETSALYVVARVSGMHAASIGIVSDCVGSAKSEADRYFFQEPFDLIYPSMRACLESARALLEDVG